MAKAYTTPATVNDTQAEEDAFWCSASTGKNATSAAASPATSPTASTVWVNLGDYLWLVPEGQSTR